MTARLTEYSRRTHGGLTHPLTEGSRLEVEGKGDRKWKGVRAEAFHHDYRKVDARAPIVAPSPVTTPDAMMSLTAIEHLDFEPEVPCEHSRHRARHADESAAFLVQVIGFCHLGGGERYALCRSGYALSWRVGVLCPVCRSPFTEPGQEPPLRIVQVLR
jgi:hypothetical protein